MTHLHRRILALVAGALVLAGGFVYAVIRPTEYETRASLLLVPATSEIHESSALMDSLERAGTVATYVEMLSARGTREQAGAEDVVFSARAIPGSRVIEVLARGQRFGVRYAMESIIPVALRLPELAGDPWRLKILDRPSPAERAGVPTMMLLPVVAAMALLASLATFTLTGTIGRAGGTSGLATPPPADHSPLEAADAPALNGNRRHDRVPV